MVGSANLDLVALAARVPAAGETVLGHGYFEAPGGKGLNQAVAAARAGATVVMVGAVGADEAGRTLRQVADTEGIDTAALHCLPGSPTGRALIAVGDDGENLIVVVPGANALVGAPAVLEAKETIESADVLLVQHEIPDDGIYAALRIARAAGCTTILNPAPARPVRPDILALVDVLVPNEHEYELIARTSDLGAVPTLVVTEGASGSRVVRDGIQERIAPFAVDSIDTVAAGDAFCGTLAASLSLGLTLDDALRRASAAGALATTRRGAVPSLPTSSEVAALIASARERPSHQPPRGVQA